MLLVLTIVAHLATAQAEPDVIEVGIEFAVTATTVTKGVFFEGQEVIRTDLAVPLMVPVVGPLMVGLFGAELSSRFRDLLLVDAGLQAAGLLLYLFGDRAKMLEWRIGSKSYLVATLELTLSAPRSALGASLLLTWP